MEQAFLIDSIKRFISELSRWWLEQIIFDDPSIAGVLFLLH